MANHSTNQISRVEKMMEGAMSEATEEMIEELKAFGIDATDWDFCQMYEKLEEIKNV